MSKKRAAVVVAVALLGGSLLLLLVRSPRQQPPSSRLAGEDQPASQPASQPSGSRALPPQRLVAASGPVVEAITVEKTEVCNDEDNLVTVTLAGDHQKDDDLRIMMPGLGAAGAQMPFRLSLAAGKQQPEMPEVVVFGRDGALAAVKVPTVTVKDCTPGPSLSVEVALTANTSATVALTATVRNPGPTPFNPVRWHWDFGDGADATTKVHTVEHSYEGRPRTSRTSSVLIHVRAANADGVELLGRQSLDLRADALDILRKKTASITSTELNPRSPAIGADGGVTPRVEREVATDPRFDAELGAARAKLGRDQVSLDDLLRLRREGAFQNLPAGDARQAPAGDQR